MLRPRSRHGRGIGGAVRMPRAETLARVLPRVRPCRARRGVCAPPGAGARDFQRHARGQAGGARGVERGALRGRAAGRGIGLDARARAARGRGSARTAHRREQQRFGRRARGRVEAGDQPAFPPRIAPPAAATATSTSRRRFLLRRAPQRPTGPPACPGPLRGSVYFAAGWRWSGHEHDVSRFRTADRRTGGEDPGTAPRQPRQRAQHRRRSGEAARQARDQAPTQIFAA